MQSFLVLKREAEVFFIKLKVCNKLFSHSFTVRWKQYVKRKKFLTFKTKCNFRNKNKGVVVLLLYIKWLIFRLLCSIFRQSLCSRILIHVCTIWDSARCLQFFCACIQSSAFSMGTHRLVAGPTATVLEHDRVWLFVLMVLCTVILKFERLPTFFIRLVVLKLCFALSF
jgi:hypothetical protein